MKKLSIGIQTFSKLLKENCIYVDKTDIIHQLITRGSYYFLSRPRRFGKSLLVSTLAEIFRGNRELFTALAISNLPYDWKEYPVVQISFSDIACTTTDELIQGLKFHLHNVANQHNIELNQNLLPSQMLQHLIRKLSIKNSVVLLIDEYDYPILKHIHDNSMAEEMREVLKNFYIAIKGLDEYLRFVFLTGISKFPRTSIFSGLNNLEDISLDTRYNNLLGYTKPEITTYFQDYLTHITQQHDYNLNELLAKIELWYDGYLFCSASTADKLYNPFSVLLFLSKERFSNYWFETGTPTFLINLLKQDHYPMQDFESIHATELELGMFDVKTIPLKTLLFQTGYLTIQGYDTHANNYILGYPNKETTDSLSSLVLSSMTSLSINHFSTTAAKLLQLFQEYKLQELHTLLTTIFAAIPYGIHVNEEKYYQTIFYLILKMINAHIIVEQQTNIGRIDAVIETKNDFFIIEFKINASAQTALQQIEHKMYYQQYLPLNKNITLIGIAFDTKIKNVSEVIYKKI